MKKLDKLILITFLPPFVLTFAVVEFILLVQTIVAYFEDFVGKDLGVGIYLQLFSYFCANIVPAALPLAVLLSCLMTFGGLGEHKELTAIKSSGISLVRIIQPIFVFVAMLSIGLYLYQDIVIPKVNLKLYSLLWDIRQTKPALDFKEGVFYAGIPNYRIKINQKMPDGKGIKDIIIYDHSKQRGNTDVIIADSGGMYTINNDRFLILELFNGNSYSDYYENPNVNQTKKFLTTSFEKSKIVFNLESFDMKRTKEELFAGNKLMKNKNELKNAVDSLQNKATILRNSSKKNLSSFYNQFLHADTNKFTIKTPKLSIDSMLNFVYSRPYLVDRAINKTRNLKSFTESHLQRIHDAEKESRKHDIEFQKKHTIPFSCLVLFLIGAPLGSIIKKGGLGVPVLISVFFFILMYVIGETGRKWARDGVLEALYSVWLSNALLIPFGFFFLYAARKDSNILELEFWKNLFTIKKE